MPDLFEFTLAYEPDAPPEDQDFIRAGLEMYNTPKVGEERHRPLTFLVRDGNGNVAEKA
jgi:hypothetical protein